MALTTLKSRCSRQSSASASIAMAVKAGFLANIRRP
jgi:hypothetical protein